MIDPNKQFAITFLTRADIARLFNESIAKNTVTTVERFTDSDPRLTDGICEYLVNQWAKIEDQGLDDIDTRYERTKAVYFTLTRYFC